MYIEKISVYNVYNALRSSQGNLQPGREKCEENIPTNLMSIDTWFNHDCLQ